jgi:hypothetical protein
LKAPLREGLNAFLAALDRYSLADLVRPPTAERMRRLLADPPVAEARP